MLERVTIGNSTLVPALLHSAVAMMYANAEDFHTVVLLRYRRLVKREGVNIERSHIYKKIRARLFISAQSIEDQVDLAGVVPENFVPQSECRIAQTSGFHLPASEK